VLRRGSLVYLDSSAIVKLALVEAESAALASFLGSYPDRTTSMLARVEVIRAVRGADPLAVPLARRALESTRMLEFDDAVVALAAEIEPSPLRSLDAIHVASALLLQPDLDVLVSYDRRVLEAARAAGIPTATPS
jgi:predicted nucleic acid-binding protein